MNKYRILSIFVVLAMVFSFANVSPASAATTTVTFQEGTATFSQNYPCCALPVGQAVDGVIVYGAGDINNLNGWGIHPAVSQNHTAVFETSTDISASQLDFKLYQYWGGAHNLGRFRLSYTTDDRSTFADGLNEGGDVTANWTVLAGATITSTGGETFTVLGDNSILVSGNNPDTTVYSVSFSGSFSGITGIRLEALSDVSLPYGGPGRQANGNFTLTELTLDATPPTTTTIIFQEGVDITVDGVGTGVIYAGTHDTFIVTANPNNTHGTASGIWLDDYPCCSDGLIRFDNIFGPGVGQIPLDATITSASIGLFIIDDGTAINFGEIHPDQPWDEATATWNSVLGGNGVTFGTDTTFLGVGISEWTPRYQWHYTDVTTSLSAWSLDPSLNNGWGWKPDGGNTSLMAFNSSENPSSGSRPYLSVTFLSSETTAPTASPTQSPAVNGLGWNNTDVTVTWNWSDEEGGSGIDNAACTTSSTSTGEGEITLTATCNDLAGNEGSASYTVKVDQTLPIADAGSDQSIHAGYAVNLDGGTSSDDNTLPEALSYNWSFDSTPAGNTATLTNADTATPSFTPNVSGEYVVQLVVTDDADNDSEPVFVTLSSLNMAPTADATATPMLPLLGQSVSLDGSASSDPDGDAISYQWAVTSKPVGSAASLTNATSAMASITPDVSGTYELTLTVSDFLESGAPVTVSFVASTAEEFAQVEIIEVSTSVVGLEPAEITTAGNQNAFGNFLTNTMEQIQKGNVDKAIADLEKAIARTDGCALRGAPDGNGAGMDWVTTCEAQASIYDSLVAALEALQY